MASLQSPEILTRLVAFPTVSRQTNIPLIEWIANYLSDFGIESHWVANETGDRSNLFATIGPMVEGGVVLSGHTDVVPTDGQPWSSDPFEMTERDARLYARGTCDMKGFIAAALSRVPVWKAMKLTRPIHFMFSYDEEIGCLGAPSMIEAARKVLPAPAAVIVGEPTGMRIATEHKGICTVRTRVRGIEAHSSLTHEGVSAVMLAGELVSQLNALARELAASSRQGTSRFVPPHSTLSVNRIAGGTAVNILAAQCEFDWDIRALPGENAKAILERLSAYADARLKELAQEGKRCSIESEIQADVPPLRAEHGQAESLARSALGASAEPIAMPFATEGGQFQSAGWSTVVCGPGRIERAHKPDEFIERSELVACEAFLERVVRRQCC